MFSLYAPSILCFFKMCTDFVVLYAHKPPTIRPSVVSFDFIISFWSWKCVGISIHVPPRQRIWVQGQVECVFSSVNASTSTSPLGADMWRQFLFSSFFKQTDGGFLINIWVWITSESCPTQSFHYGMVHVFWQANSPSRIFTQWWTYILYVVFAKMQQLIKQLLEVYFTQF